MTGATVLLLAVLSAAESQLQLAEIRGVVIDDSGTVLPEAIVELTDPLGGVVASRHSDGAGRFTIASVAPGRYALATSLSGFETSRRDLTVAHALPIDVSIRLSLRANIAVIVDEAATPELPATRASIAGSSIAQVPIRNSAKGIQEVVATLPGWSTEDNGLLHSRGTDDGFLYVIDGVPVYERLDQLNGLAPDTSAIESINVMTGYLPAEFGYKAGGVIDVRSKAAGPDWSGAVTADAGSEQTASLSGVSGGALSRSVAMGIAAAWQESDRFLDPVHPENLHNHGHAGNGSLSVTWTSPDRSIVTINAGGGSSDYEVPNTLEQQAVDQDQHQGLEHWFGTGTWQHVWAPSLYTQLSAYGRRSSADLVGGQVGTPLIANASRALKRFGAIGSATWHNGAHTLKAGSEIQGLSMQESFEFAVVDPEAAEQAGFSDAALEFDEDTPFVFNGAATPLLFSAYVQDEWQMSGAITIAGGIRFDRTALLLPRTHFSPRVGMTYRVPGGTVLRGSVSRFFQPPQPEYLLLSSSPEARVLSPFADDDSGGGADIEPERQWAFEAGVDHDVTSWMRIDGAIWYRRIRDAADPNVFAGTTIIFPNAVATGRASGLDLRLEVRRRRAWSGYASFAAGRVRQRGPITGGLFLEEEVADIAGGEEFVPDHDQAVVASGGVMWMHPSRAMSFSLAVRYESGTPIGDADDADALPGAEMVDFDRGRVKPRTIASVQAQVPMFKRQSFSGALRLTVQNIFDSDYAYNFGNPFSGTHFGAPRTASIGVRIDF